MTISFRCPHCHHKLRAPDDVAGQRAKCKCGRMVIVPNASSPEFSQASDEPSRPIGPTTQTGQIVS